MTWTMGAAGIHRTSIVAAGAEIGRDVHVGPYCQVGRGCRLGDRAVLVGQVSLGDGVWIGAGSVLFPQVVIYPGARVAAACRIHAAAVIGVEPFAYEPHLGRLRAELGPGGETPGGVILEDDVHVGPLSTVERGLRGPTVVRRGARLGAHVHVGHDAVVGEMATLTAQVGLASAARIGRETVLLGQVGVAAGARVGAGAVVMGQSLVAGALRPDGVYFGSPARPRALALRALAAGYRRARDGSPTKTREVRDGRREP